MSGEALYERYKDALKRGHVASLRGHLEEALTAYAEAAAIAPERATPHSSAAMALMRRKRPADALRHYTTALTLAPRDEASLLGRAQALVALDRRAEAADGFDAVADLRATNGKLADAVDAARRALELAEGRERRRTLVRLIARLRASEPGEPGRLALERALLVLEGSAVAPVAQPGTAQTMTPGVDEAVEAARAAENAGAAEAAAMAAAADAEGALDETPPTGAEPSGVHAAEAGPIRPALDRDLPEDLDIAILSEAAVEGLEAGAGAEGVERVLDLAAAHRRMGHVDAALDACYLALSLLPDDVGLHLALVELYDDRGWGVLAVEKLDLLDRIAALDDDAPAAGRVAAARTARG